MAKEVEKKSKKEKKHFFKDFKAELKKVIWPTPKQVANNTVAVITIVLITAVIVFILDLIFGALNTHGIDNIRNLVKNSNTAIEENYVDNEVSESEVLENSVVQEDTTIENDNVQE